MVRIKANFFFVQLTLLIFLVMSQMPLYGIVSSDTSDPLYWLRMMLASNRGTLMELGITPIISSGMVFQVCCSYSHGYSFFFFFFCSCTDCMLSVLSSSSLVPT